MENNSTSTTQTEKNKSTKAFFKIENEKWFKFYEKLPMFLLCVLATLCFIWSIIDVSVFQYGYYSKSYGVMRLDSAFVALLIWWVIGAILSFVTYIVAKIVCSYKILVIKYLKKISEKE